MREIKRERYKEREKEIDRERSFSRILNLLVDDAEHILNGRVIVFFF